MRIILVILLAAAAWSLDDAAREKARAALREGAVALDRVNKRVYARLKSEARMDPALANELGRIDTGAPICPPR